MSQWVDVAAEGDIFEGAAIGVAVGGYDIAVYKTEAGEVFPYHRGRFDIRNGAATLEPCVEAIRSYPVKVDGGRVWVEID